MLVGLFSAGITVVSERHTAWINVRQGVKVAVHTTKH